MTIEKTTESAEELIDRYSDDPKVAVILASTFIHARLRTIVNVYLKQRGRSDVSVVNENVDLKPTLKICVCTRNHHLLRVQYAQRPGSQEEQYCAQVEVLAEAKASAGTDVP